MKTTVKLTIGLLVLALALVIVPMALAQQDGGPISYGQTVTGEISNDVREIRYTFSGTEGDTISIRMSAATQGLDSYINLYGPDGTLISSDDDSAGNLNSLLGPMTLGQTGNYAIGASRCCSLDQADGSQGQFTLTLEQLTLQSLTVGETVSVDLVDSQQAFFSIPVNASAVYTVVGTVLDGTENFYMTVRNAANVVVNQAYGSTFGDALIDPLFMTEGSATLSLQLEQRYGPDGALVTGRSTRVGITVQVADVQPIEIGASASGVLNDGNLSDHYSFTGSASRLLRLSGEMPAGDQSFEVVITDTNNQMFFSGNTEMTGPGGNSFAVDPVQLPYDAPYLLIVRRINYGQEGPMRPTNYTITLGDTQTPLLAPGTEVIGSVSEGTYEQVYRMDVTEGQRMVLTLRSVDASYKPTITVTGPNNQPSPTEPTAGIGGGYGGGGGGYIDNFIFSANGAKAGVVTYEWVADKTGVYLFRVNLYYGPEGPSAGQFGLKVDVR